MARTSARMPCTIAFFRELALPCSVLGPVDLQAFLRFWSRRSSAVRVMVGTLVEMGRCAARGVCAIASSDTIESRARCVLGKFRGVRRMAGIALPGTDPLECGSLLPLYWTD